MVYAIFTFSVLRLASIMRLERLATLARHLRHLRHLRDIAPCASSAHMLAPHDRAQQQLLLLIQHAQLLLLHLFQNIAQYFTRIVVEGSHMLKMIEQGIGHRLFMPYVN